MNYLIKQIKINNKEMACPIVQGFNGFTITLSKTLFLNHDSNIMIQKIRNETYRVNQ